MALTLILGASCLGVSPIFVRLSEVGPISTAFWRSAIAVPLILVLINRLKFGSIFLSFDKKYFLLVMPGIFLGIDHAAWHHGIMLTSVANATLFASMAPVFVVIYGWVLFSWIVSKRFIISLVSVLTGSVCLLFNSLEISFNNFYGDLLSLFAGACYAVFLLITGLMRESKLSPYVILLYGTFYSALTLFIIFLFSSETLFPSSIKGWGILISLSVISQIFGIGLITWALGKVKTGLASLTLMSEPLSATLLAWIILGEYIGMMQFVGAFIILMGIVFAQNNTELKK